MRPRKYKSRVRITLPDRTVSLTGEPAADVRALLREQDKRFRAKFGRAPGPEDPIFFDPDADTPQPLSLEKHQADWNAMLDRAAAAGGIDPAKIYASKKVGVLPTEANWDLMRREDRDAWVAAVEEYNRMHPPVK